ncbi:type III secretion system rspB [Pseudomonas sp. MAFF 301380]|uniref:Type III secretion system rspB n=2 Tax=Pseudomonas lactucae TaxID=2813360 RepID=A0A9X1C4M2_9PSED|nr:type III secretion system rspB [Pseudomonas lactucae]MBN2988006.1 type III secretion system rspB [Pseudomonas lactucae]
MKKSLKAFNSELSEKHRLSYSSHLSNTMLMTQMLVKSVGKGAQLIEKISNLQ